MIPIPIIIPHHNSEPSHCPNCGQIEHKIEVCKHCKYEYPKETWSPKPLIFAILTVIFIAGLIIIGNWYLKNYTNVFYEVDFKVEYKTEQTVRIDTFVWYRPFTSQIIYSQIGVYVATDNLQRYKDSMTVECNKIINVHKINQK